MALGSPLVPAVSDGARTISVLHHSQVAAFLGLEADAAIATSGLAWDTITILSAWFDEIGVLDADTMQAPTPSRERTVHFLTINVFHPFELLPTACTTGDFPWFPESEDERLARELTADTDLKSWAGRTLAGWQGFVMDAAERLDGDRVVTSPRGDATLDAVLASQRWHAAFHLEQLRQFLVMRGLHPRTHDGVLKSMPGLDLPNDVF